MKSGVFQTHSAHGKSSCNAQGQGATTCCGHCRQANHKHTRKAMMRACNEPWMRCWEDFQEDHRTNRELATLPMRLGGLGVRSARRIGILGGCTAHDEVADAIIQRLVHVPEPGGCLHELNSAGNALDHHGFVSRPGWIQLSLGARPPPMQAVELGEWPHGWQYYASSASEHHFRRTVVLNQTCAANQAHLRSHSGCGSSQVLHGCPSSPEFRVQPHLFRTLVLD